MIIALILPLHGDLGSLEKELEVTIIHLEIYWYANALFSNFRSHGFKHLEKSAFDMLNCELDDDADTTACTRRPRFMK